MQRSRRLEYSNYHWHKRWGWVTRKGVKINSGYRTKSHNSSIKGSAPNSYHMDGVAADIAVYVKNDAGAVVYAGEGLNQAAKVIIANNGGVGIYPNRVHIEVSGKYARW